MKFHHQILFAMLGGAVVGVALNGAASAELVDPLWVEQVAGGGEWLGRIFLALLNMIVVPLIFTSLVASVVSAGSRPGLGRLGAATLTYYVASSLVAITVGLVMVNVFRPGDGLEYATLVSAARGAGAAVPETPDVEGGAFSILVDLVFRMIPSNVVQAATSNRDILSLIFFALVFGLAANATGGRARDTVGTLTSDIYEVMLTLTNGVLRTAPIGIGGYVLAVTATTGLDVVSGLLWYMLTVFLGLCFHALVVLPLFLVVFARRNPIQWLRAMSEALLMGFSTASSSGTLPLTLKCVREKGRVSDRVASFTLPLGATINMDGTALYEVVAVLFIAQTMGLDLDLGQQVVVAFTSLLASIGAAGIPHAGTVMMVVVLQAVGLPTDGILVILAVDRVLDMCRTTVNIWSDSIGAALIARLDDVLHGGGTARGPEL